MQVQSKSCSAKLYWNGPTILGYNVWGPGIIVTTVTPTYTFPAGSPINLNLNAAGTWYVALSHNIFNVMSLKESIV